MEFDITGNVKLNTQQAKQDLNSFMGSVNSMPSMIGTNEAPSIMNGAQYQNKSNQLNDSFGNLQDQMQKVLESFKSLCTALDDTANKAGVDFTKVRKDQANQPNNQNQQNKNMPVPSGQVRSVVGVIESGSNLAGNVANGNISGAMISGVSSVGSTLMSGAGAAASGGLTALAGPLAGIAGLALGTAAVMKGADAFATKYEDALPGLDKILTTFGGDEITRRSQDMNDAYALDTRSKIVNKGRGTGLDNESFISLTNSLGAYGINNVDRAADIARLSGTMGAFTNTDAKKLANFGGLIERYGGNGTESIENAYKAARASGLDKNQFGEFLDGLSRVIETGISKGFVNSTEEISNNLGMLAKLSDNNPLWQGKEGANRYMTMMNSVASKTDLQSTSSILLARTANELAGKDKDFYKKQLGEDGYLSDNSFLNTMAYIEKGNMDPEFMKAYRDRLNKTYGNDTESKVATLKETYGLNWEGSIQLYNMMQKIGTNGYTEEEFKKESQNILSSSEYMSDNKQMIDVLGKINENVVKIGEPIHDIKISGLETVSSTTNKIYSFLMKDSYDKMANDVAKDYFSIGEGKDKKAFIDKVKEEISAGNYESVDEMLTWMQSADYNTKLYYNNNDAVMNLFDPSKREYHTDYTPTALGSDTKLSMDEFVAEMSNDKFITTEGEKKLQSIFKEIQKKYNNGRGLSESDHNAYTTEMNQCLEIANKYVTGDYDSKTKSGWQFDSDGIIKAINELKSVVETSDKTITINMPSDTSAIKDGGGSTYGYKYRK